MHSEPNLIFTIAVSLAYAFAGGYVAARIGLPPLVGYLVAGIALGPFTPGVVADRKVAQQLAEIGVILLMFGVGMHFSVPDLLAARRVALPGAVAQMAAAVAMGTAMAVVWGWTLQQGLVFGLALSVASTVVLVRALESQGRLESEEGKIAVGWLVVEDLAMVSALVLLPALVTATGGSGAGSLLSDLGATLGKVALFALLMLVVGKKVFPKLLERVQATGSRELFTLAVVALALGIALGSARLFGASFALGAFLAGMVITESDLSHRAARDLRPLQDAFAALFFVAVGMLFDPAILITRPLQVLAVVGIIVIGKSAAAFAIVHLIRRRRGTAAFVSAALSQIGEFSFILAELGIVLGVLPEEGLGLIIAGALISIMLNPLMFLGAQRWAASAGRAERAA